METSYTIAGCVCFCNDNFLLLKQQDNDMYGIPAGIVEKSDDYEGSCMECIKTKLFEKIQLNISLDKIKHAGDFDIKIHEIAYKYRLYVLNIDSDANQSEHIVWTKHIVWTNLEAINKFELAPDTLNKIQYAIDFADEREMKEFLDNVEHSKITEEESTIDEELESILGKKNEMRNDNPLWQTNYLVSFGPPGAGKTTALTFLKNILDSPIPVISDSKDILEKETRLKLYLNNAMKQKKLKYFFLFQIEILTEKFKQIITAPDFSLIDESILSTLAYTIALKRLHWIDNDQYQTFLSTYRILYKITPKPKKILYLHCQAKTMLDRIEKRGREVETKYTEHYLTELKNAFNDIAKYLKNNEYEVIEIDTDGVNLEEMKEKLDAEMIGLWHSENVEL